MPNNQIAQKVEKYIQCLLLQGEKKNVLCESLEFLKELNAQDISENINSLAKLFCAAANNYDERMSETECVGNLFIDAFKNMRNAEYDEQNDTVEFIVIRFLKRLNDMKGMTGGNFKPIAMEMQAQFNSVCDILEKMKAIFKLKEDDDLFFPIGKLLAYVIDKASFKFRKLDEITLNTFLLALEYFDAANYKNELDKLNEIIENNRLKFLTYIKEGAEKIGGSLWKENFKNNGALILKDNTNKKIYIRHTDEKYFSSPFVSVNGNLESEINSEDDKIAFFYEMPFEDNATFYSAKDLLMEENFQLKVKFFNIVYNKECYNMFFDNAFIFENGNLMPINPFTKNDGYIILPDTVLKTSVENVTDIAMAKYSLITFFGKGLDFTLVGSIGKLLSISNVEIEKISNDLKKTDKYFQNTLINSWLMNSEDMIDSLAKLLDIYFGDVRYVKTRKEFDDKSFSGISWLPLAFPMEELEKEIRKLCELDAETGIIKIEIEKKEEFTGESVYKKSNGKIAPELIDFKDEEIKERSLFYTVEKKEKYFASTEIDKCVRLYEKIKESNEGLIQVSNLPNYTSQQIKSIFEKMKLQADALCDIINAFVDFYSIARLRLLHHIIYNGILDNQKWTAFRNLLDLHQSLKFEFVRGLDIFDDENALIVPKENQESDNVFVSIINEYLRKKATRNHDFYYSELSQNADGVFLYRDRKINKVVFLFDTIQSGVSTIRNLKFYFENFSFPADGGIKNNSIKYHFNGAEIQLETVIKTNNADVEVVALYASELGVQKVKEYLTSYDFNPRIIFHEKIERPADEEFMKNVQIVYGGQGNLAKGNYPIIREFNQPKKNIFPENNLKPEKIASIFVKKYEHKKA